MNSCLLASIYKALLSLYPPAFRAEFGDEMQEVFSSAAEDARQSSRFGMLEVLIGELRDLPASLLNAHRQARRSLHAAAAGLQRLAPLELSWQELLATLAVFLLPAVILLLRQSPPESGALGLPSALIFLAAMLVVGVLRRLPLRSLPYLGAILVIAAYLFLFQWVADLVSPALISNFAPGPWDHSTHLLLKAASTGMLWLTLFCLTLLVIAFLALYNRFQPLCWRIRHDWSLLSFLLHGEAVFTLLLLVERHRTERPFAIACLLWLAAGAWFYLRSSQRWKRAIALVSGLSLGIWAVASGVIFTAGGSLVLSSRAIIDLAEPSALAMLGEAAGRILIVPIWILLVLLLPAWFSRLSQLSRGIRNKGV